MEEIIKKRTPASDPQYIGGYLNMARHNVFMLINYLTDRFKEYGFERLDDDGKINNGTNILSKVFNNSSNINYEDKWNVFNYLVNRHHLPVLRYFKERLDGDEENKFDSQEDFFQAVSDFLNVAFNELVKLRNSYTHYLAIDDSGNLTERKIDLDDKIIKDIEGLFRKAPSFSFLRNIATQKEEDYSHLKFYKLFEDSSNVLTDQGLYFFICIFLERQYAIKFLKRFPGFKNETLPPFKATLKAFTAYSLKRPDEKIKNEDLKQSLLMEMLNELNKCPKKLFYHLTDKDKKEFEPKLKDETAKSNITLNSINYEDLKDKDIEESIRELISLKRYEDRYPYFALRYLEETDALKNIRFQITLGKVTIKKYTKKIIDEVQNRRISKVINAFGKLSDFEDIEKDKETALNALINGDDDTIEFEQYAPHYGIRNNKIGFYLFNENDNKTRYTNINSTDETNQSTGFISIHDLPKLVLLDIYAKGQAEKFINNFLTNSNSNILNKTVLDKIKQDLSFEPIDFTRRIVDDTKKLNDEELEKEIIKREEYLKFLKDRRRILNDKLKEYKLSANQLPSKVLDYLMDISEPDHKKIIHNSIRQIKIEIKELLFKLKKKQEFNEKPKLGELATFLTYDIINMVIDKDTKEKITPPYFNKLQNKIAFFSLNKDAIIELLDELNLFDKEIGHVFLSKKMIQDENGVIDFYKKYLEVKSKWITDNLLKNTVGYCLPENKKLPYSFEKLRKYRKDINIENWISNKIQLPVNLPASLFDKLLSDILKNKIDSTTKTGISNYLSIFFKNDSQPFYQYDRKYKINKEDKVFNVNELNSKVINEKYGKKVEANERLIRFTKTKDRVMLLMCNELIKKDIITGLSDIVISLKNIHPYSDFNPLDTPITISKKILKKNKRIIARDTDEWKEKVKSWINLSKEEKEKNPENKIWYSCTIKDFGRLNKVINDRRLSKLLDYLDSSDIPFSLLEYELMEYDRTREKIFDNIFELEKSICLKDSKGICDIELNKTPRDFNEVQFDIYVDWLKNKGIDINDRFITEVRNKFAHSKFPPFEFIGIDKKSSQQILEFEQKNQEAGYKGNKYKSLSQQIYDKYNAEIEKILEQVTKL